MPFILSLAASLLGWGKIALVWLEKLPWYVLALAACVAVILWQHGAETRKDARIASLSATLVKVQVAQAQAQVAAQAAHDQQEAAYKAKAEETDNAYKLAFIDAGKKADAYIAAHTIHGGVQPSAASGSASATVASTESPTPASADRPGAGSDMVAVTAADVDVCTVNTKRLQAAHDWALTLDR